MKTIIIGIISMLLLFCSCSEKTINIGSSIKSKTTIKSKYVCLDTTIVTVANGHDLTIQCKKLIVNQNVKFEGNNINVAIEYRRLKGKNVSITSSEKSTLILKKKKIKF